MFLICIEIIRVCFRITGHLWRIVVTSGAQIKLKKKVFEFS